MFLGDSELDRVDTLILNSSESSLSEAQPETGKKFLYFLLSYKYFIKFYSFFYWNNNLSIYIKKQEIEEVWVYLTPLTKIKVEVVPMKTKVQVVT